MFKQEDPVVQKSSGGPERGNVGKMERQNVGKTRAQPHGRKLAEKSFRSEGAETKRSEPNTSRDGSGEGWGYMEEEKVTPVGTDRRRKPEISEEHNSETKLQRIQSKAQPTTTKRFGGCSEVDWRVPENIRRDRKDNATRDRQEEKLRNENRTPEVADRRGNRC
ncbi:hypothetical protein B0H17DRAFT_1154966 [Mycena rosella]|uniref:Uncharacterized protein n=1 Tax=Mycena rosella TaxID=1033263 RepID=A0AAD7AX21_MYCRO|nr:hypothetical protein B0H17DRAFT_1154966 [Mycena rosella]